MKFTVENANSTTKWLIQYIVYIVAEWIFWTQHKFVCVVHSSHFWMPGSRLEDTCGGHLLWPWCIFGDCSMKKSIVCFHFYMTIYFSMMNSPQALFFFLVRLNLCSMTPNQAKYLMKQKYTFCSDSDSPNRIIVMKSP